MSETVVDSTPRVRSYGNITDTKVTGIMGLSLAATAVAGAGAIGALLVLWFGQLLWLAVLLLVLTVMIFMAGFLPVEGGRWCGWSA